MRSGRIRLRVMGLAVSLVTAAAAGLVLHARGVTLSQTTWDAPASGGTVSIAVTTTIEGEPWTTSAEALVTTVAGSTAGIESFADGAGTDARFAIPNHIAADAAGNVYVADWNNNRIRKVTPAGVVTTVAGSGVAGGTDGTGTAASFNGPRGIAIDAAGTLYVAESWGHRVRKITSAGLVSTVAGNGTAGYVDANGTAARFWYPSGVAVDGGGNLYVTEEHNSTVRKITPAGDVTTLAGNGTAGYVDATGTAARLSVPFGVAIDGAGNLYVADSGNSRIRKVTPAGAVTTVAGSGTPGAADGNGTTAQFNDPWGLVVDAIGNTYVADLGNHRIRRIAPDGSVTTLAGTSAGYADGGGLVARFTEPVGLTLTDDGSVLVVSERNGGNRVRRLALPAQPAVTTLAGSTSGATGFVDAEGTEARFAIPNHIAADAAGNVYVADWSNNRIRQVTPFGDVTTFAGSGAAGGEDGMGAAASFNGPRGIAIDAAGTLYVAESWGHRIRKVSPAGAVTTIAGNGTAGYVDARGTAARFWYPSGIAVDGDGNLYVTEEHNSTVRKITPAGDVTTLAGNGTPGYVDAIGTAARFNEPYGVAVDAAGNVYVADSMNHRIRKVTSAGVVATLAGSGTPGTANSIGTAAQLNQPWGLAVDAAGNVYVADLGNHRIRRIAPGGSVATLAGGNAGFADGQISAALFTQPAGVALTGAGAVLIVSERNGGNRVRRVTSGADWLTASPGSGVGSGSVTLTAEPSSSPFPRTASVMIAGQPVVVTQDGAASSISVSPAVVEFGTLLAGAGPVDRALTVANTGAVTLSGWQWSFGGLGNPVGGTCGSAAASPGGLYSLTPGQSCTFVLRFTPVAAGVAGGPLSVAMKSAPGGAFDVTWGGTWTATVAPPAIALDGLTQTYDGTPRAVTATPTPAGLPVTVTYTGAAGTTYGPSTTPPTAAGTYRVSATTAFGGLEEATLTVEKAAAVIVWPTPAPIPAGTPLSAAQLNATTSAPPAGTPGVETAPIETMGPVVLTVDAAGALYVGEYDGGRVLKVQPSGDVQALATTGGVYGIAVDPVGTVYVSEVWNHRILKILPDGTVSTLAGSLSRGSADGIGAAARFYYPCGLALDGAGMLYVADRDNHRIRRIDVATGAVTTVAGSVQGDQDGTGAAARFNTPWDVAFDASGTLYVADTGNMKIRKLSAAGAVTTLAGSSEGYADGTGAGAQFAAPWGIAIGAAGMVYVADGGNGNGDFFGIGNGNNRVRRVSPAGEVTTVAGSGAFGDADGLPAAATFNVPRDVAVGPDGTVFVADQHNNKVRVVSVGPLGTFTYDPPAGTVLPDGVHTLSVTFTPQDEANWRPATASVELQVQAAPPLASISVSPAVVEFGTLLAGAGPVDRVLTVANTGAVTLSGWQWSFGGLGNPVGGTCGSAAASPEGLYSLTPGQSCTFVLRFTPVAAGVAGGPLSVGMRSSAAEPGTWDVTWAGSWTAAVQAPPTTGAISGTVTDADNGAPVVGVTVYVYDADGTQRLFTVPTDGAGMYSVAGVPPGTYYLMSSNNYGYLHQLYKNLPCVSGACDKTSGTAVTVTAGATTGVVDFALVMGGRIAGTVTDAATGAPLAGVTLTFYDANNVYESTATTDASGVYTRSSLATGLHYAKTTNGLGYLDELYNDMLCGGGNCPPLTGTGIPVTAGATTTGIDFALTVGGSISGTVTSAATGTPLAGVTVTVYNATGSSLGSVVTNASGVYATTGLPTGTYYLRTSNSLGYVDELYDGRPCPWNACRVTEGVGVSVSIGAETSGVDFELAAGGAITGLVTASGAPLAGVSVTVYIVDPGRGYWGTNSTTDASGGYTKQGLPTGTYYVRTSNSQGYVDELFSDIPCPGGSCSPYTNGTGVSVTAGAVMSGIDFGLASGGTIAGTVTDAATGEPLAGVSVYVYNSTNSSVGSATTNPSGVYTKTGMPPGTYYLRTSNNAGYVDELYNDLPCAVGCSPYTAGAGVVVTAGATTSGIDFGLAVGGTITGTVTAAGSGAPLPGVSVYVYNSSNSGVGSTVTTNASGVYAKTGLATGTYYVRTMNSLGYQDELYNDLACVGGACTVTTGAPVAVTVGSTTGGIDFSLAVGGTITGTVTSAATGEPLAGVSVYVYNSTNSSMGSATTNASGVYAKTGLSTGAYYVRTSNGLGYQDELYNDLACVGGCSPYTAGTGVVVTAGATTSGIDFGLTVGGTITGTVTDAGTGAPLGGVSVYVYTSSNRSVGSATTNASGVYARTGLSTGTYHVRTMNSLGYQDELYNGVPCAGGCSPYTVGTGVAVTAGATTGGIDFGLAAGGTITGTVTDAGTGAPLANVSVQVYTATGSSRGSATTNASGVYTTTGYPTGSYYVRTSNSLGYVDELYNDLLCPGGTCTVTTGVPVAVTVGSTTGGINFGLAGGGSLTGTVTHAGTGAPLANVSVRVYNGWGAAVGSSISTNASGVYSKAGLSTGTYYVLTSNSLGYVDELYRDLSCPGGACTVTTGAPVAVTTGSPTAGVNFSLAVGGTITGTVTDAATGAPLANVSVQVYTAAGSSVGSSATDTSGGFTKTGLPTGTYYVRTSNSLGYVDEVYNDLSCPGGACTVADGPGVSVTAGETTSGINFSLAVGGTIAGTVTDAGTGAPLASVRVQVYTGTGGSAGSAWTDTSGVFAKLGLAAGTYFVRTSNSLGYVDELYADVPCPGRLCEVTSGTGISVTVGATTAGVDFGLERGGTIAGTVTDAGTGAPLANVGVHTYSSSGLFLGTVTTDASGMYAKAGLPAGACYVRTSNGLGYFDEVFENLACVFGGCAVTDGAAVSVTAGATTTGIDFGLGLGGTITGTVTDAGSGAPLVGVHLYVYGPSGSIDVSTNASGVYAASGLPAGTYYLLTSNRLGYVNELYNDLPCAFGACTMTDGTGVNVTAGATSGAIDFGLVLGGIITGTVTDAGTASPIEGVRVYTYDSSGALVSQRTYTSASGEYTVTGLPAGTYYVRTKNYLGYVDELHNGLPCPDGACTVTAGAGVTVAAGATASSIDFRLALGGGIGGTVTDARTGEPLLSVSVSAYSSSGNRVGSAYTDGYGWYKITGLPAGTYYVRTANSLGFEDEVHDDLPCPAGACAVTIGAGVSVETGTTTSGIDFGLALKTAVEPTESSATVGGVQYPLTVSVRR